MILLNPVIHNMTLTLVCFPCQPLTWESSLLLTAPHVTHSELSVSMK